MRGTVGTANAKRQNGTVTVMLEISLQFDNRMADDDVKSVAEPTSNVIDLVWVATKDKQFLFHGHFTRYWQNHGC